MRDPNGLALARLATARACAGLPDHLLLERFAAHRDEGAFAALVERHGPVVLDAALAVLQNLPDAEDVFQATFLVLARKAETIRNRASLGCWLHGVARRIARRALRARTRRDRHEAAAPTHPGPPAGDALTWGEVRALVHEELARLPESVRGPVLLCYLEGLTQDEAAVRLGVPKGTLRGRLERGRAALRSRLARRGLAPAVALLPVALGRAVTPPVRPPEAVEMARAAAGFAAGAAGVPERAARLAKGALRAMVLSRLSVGFLLAAVAAVGIGLAVPGRDANPAAGAPAPRPPEPRADFDDLTVAIRPSGISGGFPATVRIRPDGTCVYEVSGRSVRGNVPAQEAGKTTHKLPADRLRRLDELLKGTDWLSRAVPKGPPALHVDEHTLTLRRGEEKSVTVAWPDDADPYKALLVFVRGLAQQESLVHRLESAPTAVAARQELDDYVRAELGQPREKPRFEIDYTRYEPWATGLVRKPAGKAADDVAAAVRLVGLRKLQSEREYLAGLGSHEDANVRAAVAEALGRLGGEKSVGPLRKMVGETDVARWELIKLGPIAVPAIVEVIRDGSEPKWYGFDSELLIRAYLDHWKDVPKPIDPSVVDAVRVNMAAPKVKSSRTEYHREFLKLAAGAVPKE